MEYKWFYRFHIEKLNYDTMQFETSHYLEQLRNAPIDSHIFRTVRNSAMLESKREGCIMHVSIYKASASKVKTYVDENGIGHPPLNEELEFVGYFCIMAGQHGSSTLLHNAHNGRIFEPGYRWNTGNYLMLERQESWRQYMARIGGNKYGNN